MSDPGADQRSAAVAAARRARRIGGKVAVPAEGKPAVELSKSAPAEDVPVEDVPVDDVLVGDPVAEAPPEPATQPADKRAADEPATATPDWARWLPAAVLGLAAVTMAVLILTFSHSVWWAKPHAAKTKPVPGAGAASRDSTTNEIRERVLAAAKDCTAKTNSYSYKTFDTDVSAGAKCTTGAQTGQYDTAMKTLIRPDALRLKATQTTQINTAGVEAVTDGGKQWSILVYGQQGITQSGAQPRTDPFAAIVRMDYVHGHWLISSLAQAQDD